MKAMILAAGLGTRMGSLTKDCPKPLLRVKGRALIEFHLEALSQAGIKKVMINTHQHREQFTEQLGHGEKYGLALHYSEENEILGTAGGIKQCLDFFENKPFILVNGDVLTDYPLLQLAEHKLTSLAHLIMVDNPTHNPNGDFAILSEKKLTYSGIALLHPKLFESLPDGFVALGEVLKTAIANQQVTAEHYQGLWISVDTPERLALAESVSK